MRNEIAETVSPLATGDMLFISNQDLPLKKKKQLNCAYCFPFTSIRADEFLGLIPCSFISAPQCAAAPRHQKYLNLLMKIPGPQSQSQREVHSLLLKADSPQGCSAVAAPSCIRAALLPPQTSAQTFVRLSKYSVCFTAKDLKVLELF